MIKNKILLVEDDSAIGLLVKESFETRNYEVFYAQNGQSGWDLFEKIKPDICIIDIMMPIKNGFILAKEIRKKKEYVPIIFLTAKSKHEDIIEGFNIGIDDYVKKPFSMEELLLRVKALIRRTSIPIAPTQKVIKIGEYIFDTTKQYLDYKGNKIKLTGKETEVLALLSENINGVLDREACLIKIWGESDFFKARSMDVFISKLRKYLKKDPTIEIINIRGKGYKLLIE